MAEYHRKQKFILDEQDLTTRKTPRKRAPNAGWTDRNGTGRYFTGRPCKRGHLAERYVKSGVCIECARINGDRYRRGDKYKTTRKSMVAKRYERRPWLFVYHGAKARAKHRNVPFSITVTDVEDAWPDDGLCPVLGIPLNLGRGKGRWEDGSPSLDRINPVLGYVPGNIAVISMLANIVKGASTDPSVFRAVAKYIEENLI